MQFYLTCCAMAISPVCTTTHKFALTTSRSDLQYLFSFSILLFLIFRNPDFEGYVFLRTYPINFSARCARRSFAFLFAKHHIFLRAARAHCLRFCAKYPAHCSRRAARADFVLSFCGDTLTKLLGALRAKSKFQKNPRQLDT